MSLVLINSLLFKKVVAGFVRNLSFVNRNLRSSQRALTLYGDETSPPVRFVLMTASQLGLELNFQNVDLFKMEHMTEAYKKINPLQKVPALMTEDSTICDSHAIAAYLCELNGGDCKLYPRDPITRARIQEMMFYNATALFPIDSSVFTEIFSGKPLDPEKLSQWDTALEFLEYRLKQQEWLSGNTILLSDICCGATVTSFQILAPTPFRHAYIHKWLQKINEEPCFDINKRGLKRLRKFVAAIRG